MKILVCIKQVPATTTVEMDEETGVLKRDGTAGKINPYDLYALETAFVLREQCGGEVAVLSMGPPQAKAVLHEALCMGADRGCLLSDVRFAGADVLATAYALAQGAKAMGEFDLIVCGKQTTDGDTAQVGPEMAEILDMPHACYAQKVQMEENGLFVEVNLGDVVQRQRMALPCLITVEKDIFTPRLSSYRRSLAVEEGQICVLTAEGLPGADAKRFGLDGSPTRVERIFPPAQGGEQVKVQGTPEAIAGVAYNVLSENKFI